jgi:hypothetical protein
MPNTRHIHVSYDPDADIWWAESDDLPGLVSESPTFNGLVDRVSAVVPELLALNSQPVHGEVTLKFSTTRQVQVA